MARSSIEVGVIGIKALVKDIKKLSEDEQGPLFKAIRDAGLHAVEPVAARTRSSVPHVEVEGQKGSLSGSVRASGTRTGAGVRMGSKAINWAGWVEFGGKRESPHLSERESVQGGRYLFPAATEPVRPPPPCSTRRP